MFVCVRVWYFVVTEKSNVLFFCAVLEKEKIVMHTS